MLRISSACWRETSWLIAIDATIVAPRLTATITDRRNHPTLRLIATPSARTRGAAGLRVDACRECMLDRNVLAQTRLVSPAVPGAGPVARSTGTFAVHRRRGARCRHLALPLHPAVRGAVRPDAAPVPDSARLSRPDGLPA